MSRDPSPNPANGPKPARPSDAPVETSPVCPNCGQGPAVVFPVLATADAPKKPKLACLLCCPKRTGDS